jgi:hypothetical protein
MEMRQNEQIATLSIVFVSNRRKMANGSVMKIINVAGVWYGVVLYINVGRDSRCELCHGRGHIERKCANKPTFAYSSGYHRASHQKCNVAGCTEKQGSLC